MFQKQTAMRNRVKKPELANLKKGNQDEADTIEGVVIEMNNTVLLTFPLEYLINLLKNAMPVFRQKFRSHLFPHALRNHLVNLLTTFRPVRD